MTGVLLVNMGGPENPKELKQFYRLMFLDKHIIPAPFFFRNLLSLYISKTRFKTGWLRYEKIGGSPLKKNSVLLADTLQKELGNLYTVKIAYSYSEPFISSSINEFAIAGITQIVAIPLYPQTSISTTSSVLSDINKALEKHTHLKINVVEEFYDHPLFINFWTDIIRKHIRENKIKNPTLLFSAHSIPIKLILKGDTYTFAISKSAELIAESLVFPYCVSYQSGMSEKSWVGPDTSHMIESLINEGKKEIVIIPISFVSENLETLYDLDVDILPNKINEYGAKISRVKIPVVHPLFINLLKKLCEPNNKTEV